MISEKHIDSGREFDFGLVSSDYAAYRDIYPEKFYNRIYDAGYYHKDQNVLDIGTGSGVLPRNMYKYGAEITATDISENQIEYAKALSDKLSMNIRYMTGSDSSFSFDENSFDCISGCQCYFYLNHEIFSEKAYHWLKSGGRLGFFYMGWLPDEDETAGASEQLIRKYNPQWSGYGDYRHTIQLPEVYSRYFDIELNEIFDAEIPFTRESWNGRIKACRGVGASLTPEQVTDFENEHIKILERFPEEFNVLHYCAVLSLKSKK